MFFGQRLIDIDKLKPTQIYLSEHKIEGVLGWFDAAPTNLSPVPVRDFLNNGNLHLTDGHSRTYVAWRKGMRQIPCVYDTSPMVADTLGQAQYEHDIAWCERFGLHHISDLCGRILSERAYEKLWRGRCGYMYDLVVALRDCIIDGAEYEKAREALEAKGLFVVGISEDLHTLHCENAVGELFEIPFHTP